MFGRKRTDEELIYADPLAGEKPAAPRPRGLRTLAAVLMATGLVILAVVTLSITIQGQGQRYQTALSLLEQKQYEAAAAELESLGDFRDSADLLARLRADEAGYAAALDLVEQQRYDDAIAAFRALEDYADSPRWAAYGVTYHRALDLMEQTAAGETQLLRRTLPGDVRFTDEGSQTAILGWEAAAAMLESLGDYEDAREKIDQCYAASALLKLAEGNPQGALACLEKMSREAAGAFEQEYAQMLP